MEFFRGDSYSKYLGVYSNQAEHQAEYLVTQLQNNKAKWSEISIEYYQMVKVHWLVAEESGLMAIRE